MGGLLAARSSVCRCCDGHWQTAPQTYVHAPVVRTGPCGNPAAGRRPPARHSAPGAGRPSQAHCPRGLRAAHRSTAHVGGAPQHGPRERLTSAAVPPWQAAKSAPAPTSNGTRTSSTCLKPSRLVCALQAPDAPLPDSLAAARRQSSAQLCAERWRRALSLGQLPERGRHPTVLGMYVVVMLYNGCMPYAMGHQSCTRSAGTSSNTSCMHPAPAHVLQ
jgi:hypothetical protein